MGIQEVEVEVKALQMATTTMEEMAEGTMMALVHRTTRRYLQALHQEMMTEEMMKAANHQLHRHHHQVAHPETHQIQEVAIHLVSGAETQSGGQ